MTDPDPALPTEVLATPAPPRPWWRRLSRRTLALLAAGAAVLVIGGVVGGVLLVSHLDAQAAASELDEARADADAARESLDGALAEAEAGAEALATRIAEIDPVLAATGAGIDEDARAGLQGARDSAQAALDADGADGGPELPRNPGGDAATPQEQRELAEEHRALAAGLRAAAEEADARADGLSTALEGLDEAVAGYLTATQAAGAALLAERGDAAEDAKTTLQAQLDALPGTETAALGETIAAYRQAVDAIVGSSEAARNPTPGGSGIRITNPAALDVVVNKRRGLPGDYVPPGLTTPAGIPGATQVRSELIAPLEQMRQAMAAEGITLRMSSAYRSFARQQTIYNGFVASQGVAAADTHSARPGNSEHQTGLAVDLDDGTGCNLNACFANRPGGQWLAANAWEYGFILRYPDGKQGIVGFTFEPWHYRYVGVDISTAMHDRGITTLEEFMGLPAAPDYG